MRTEPSGTIAPTYVGIVDYGKEAGLAPASDRVWSAEQEAFYVEMAEGRDSVILEAFAGTGKSTTIVEGGRRAPERQQLYCAFAKRNQLDLAEKLKGNDRAEAKTLHGVGLATVMTFWEGMRVDKSGWKRKAALVEAVCGVQAPDAVKRLVGKLVDKGREMAPQAREAGSLVDVAIEFDCTPGEQWENDGFGLDYVEARALDAMELAATKKPAEGIDYADMLFLPVRNRWLRPRYDLIFVDERQDMTFTQLEIALGVGRGRIVLVGDVNQAIYGFRGADTNAAIRLREQLKAKVMTLSTTYRCPRLVVDEARRLVPAYTSAPSAPDGEVRHVGSVEKMIAEVRPNDYILSRTNAPLAKVAMALIRSQKAVRVQGKDIGAGLKAIVEKVATGKAATSIPQFFERLRRWEEREVERAEKADKPAAVELIRDKAETILVVADGVSGVPELKARLDYLFDDERKDAIVCSSVHKAKGLEAERVYVLSATLYPKVPQHVAEKMTPDQAARRAQEERNIEYVAITRAMQTLVWVAGR